MIKEIHKCIDEERLKDILIEQRSEVLGVLLSTFNKELYEQGLKDEAYQEGIQEGIEKALIELVQKKISKGKTVELIADEIEQPIEYVQKLIKEYIN